MKKHSVLIRRAVLFTAIVAFAAVAVGLPVFCLLHTHFAAQEAQDVLLPQARTLAQAIENGMPADSVAMLQQEGGRAWLSDVAGTHSLTGDMAELPESVLAALPEALGGYEFLGRARIEGRMSAYAVVPVNADGTFASALVASLPLSGSTQTVLCIVLALLAGLTVAGLTGMVLVHLLLVPVVRPLADLRDVAVAVAEGNLDTRASESAPGDLGELGKAINNVSIQLARSMYSLILERNRLRHMLDGLSEGIIAVDAHGHVTHTNPALDRMFTKCKGGVHFPDPRMKVIEDKTIWEDFDSVISTGASITRNLEVRDMTLRLTITPTVDELGAIAGAVGLFADITQLERLERTRREYVSNVSHELRTPLTAMRALIEPLKEGMVTTEADRMRYYDIIMREVMRLSRLINDQLELSRLQSGTLAIQKSRIALDDLVYDVCDRYVSVAEEKGLELKVLTDFSGCPMVWANEDRVEQMLIILLDNAIKYTEQGSVSVLGSWDDEKVVLTVRDTGVGIDDEDLPYVFDRFYKVDKAHSGKGSGLGLSIARELLKRMDEDIWVASEKGKGSEFSFTVHREAKSE